jgi:voltage-gated potassium channel
VTALAALDSRTPVRLQRWRRATEWPLTALALVFLVAYAWEVIGDLHGPRAAAAEDVQQVLWVLFLVDYLVSLTLARPRRRWFITHLHDLVVVAVPMLRPLRLLRLLVVVLRLHRGSVHAFRGRVALYVASTSAALVLIAGLAALDAEQDVSGANIKNIGEAVWWAFSTITTVGYGEFYPVTLAGRLVAAGLMAAGVAVAGSVTGLLASWFVEQVRARPSTRVTVHQDLDVTVRNDGASGMLVEDLERLAALHDRAALSDEEFADAKRWLLNPRSGE